MKLKTVSGIMLILLLINTSKLAVEIQPAIAESATLTIIGPWAGTEMDRFLVVLEAFENRTGINTQYKILRAEDLATILPAHFAAETAPGELIFMWPWFIKEKGKEDHIIDVTDLVNEADFLPGALDPVKACNTLYGGAFTGKAKPGFWYRKSFFEIHGLRPPSDWAEFLSLLDDIAAIPGIVNPIVSGDDVGWPLSDITEHFLVAFGSPQLHKDLVAGTAAWNSSTVRAIFEDKLIPMLEAGYFSEPIDWTTALDDWWDGDYGLYFMGSWITGMVENATDLAVFPLPQVEGLVFAADYFFIPTYTEYPEEAEELFKFLASQEAQELQVAQGGHIASSIHVSPDAYPPVDRMVAEILDGKELLSDLDDTVGGEFQVTFWNQLKLLWMNPAALDVVLATLEAASPKPLLPGDLCRDGKIDIRDIAIAALAFGSYLGHPRWNSQADINQDEKVDIRDIVLIAKNFGKTE